MNANMDPSLPRESAKRVLLHYMQLFFQGTKFAFNHDNQAEIEGIVDDIDHQRTPCWDDKSDIPLGDLHDR